uniref:CadC transcriptional regulator n=1 Tax=Pectobacterium carotovorum TaxID=554 RepID=A0A0N9NBL2_PECCA|nr:helix-turn-helix domain-containing protein [Pectobacterium carotovorum]ALG88709.1 CadC transcriptional regulator [Pectobacterium carotovorum]
MPPNDFKKMQSLEHSLYLVNNIIYYHNGKNTTKLSEYEVKLFQCLLKGLENKEDIIYYIWGYNNTLNIESKYNQLICRVRKKLMRAGFPRDIIVTKPRSSLTPGVFLNKSCLLPSESTLPVFEVESRVIGVFQM